MKITSNAGYDVILMTSQEEQRRYRYKENLLFRKLCSERHVHEKRDFDHGGFGIQNRTQKGRAMVLALCTILNVEDLHEITQKGVRLHNGHLIRILHWQYRRRRSGRGTPL